MRIGCSPLPMVSSLITTSLMAGFAEGTSNMMSIIDCSRMARSPRAPERCFWASWAMELSAPLVVERLGGFTDNESSSAQCGSNVVTSYSSQTAGTFSSLIPTFNNFQVITAASALGVASSSDGGASFTALPFLNAGPSVDVNRSSGTATLFAVLGNPSVACSSAKRFYVADTPFFVADITLLAPDIFNEQLFNGVGINISSDGGQSWADPVPAVLKNQNHFIDSGWLTVDPNDPNRLYVSYIDLDFEADFPFIPLTSPPRCSGIAVRVASELVTSHDGGHTWSSPSIIREDCLPIQQGLPQGFQAASTRLTVAADGRLSAAFLLFHPLFGPDGVTVVDYKPEVHVTQSANHGSSFGPDVKISDLVQVGDGSHSFRPIVQGFFEISTIPVLAADPIKRGKKQDLYIAWTDGRDNQKPDGTAFFGTYNFGDILLSKSHDGGVTWSPPRAISPTPSNFKGAGRDQLLPSIAVDRDGTVAVCYYDGTFSGFPVPPGAKDVFDRLLLIVPLTGDPVLVEPRVIPGSRHGHHERRFPLRKR